MTHPNTIPDDASATDSLAEAIAGSGQLPLNIRILVALRDWGIFALLFALLILFSIWAHPYFLTTANLLLILNAASLTAIFAVAVAVGVMSGALDLSVPGVAAMAAVVAGKIIDGGGAVWVGLLAGFAVGVILGLVNGTIVLAGGFNPLIVTIGTFGMYSGLASMITSGYTVSGLRQLEFMGTRHYFDVAAPVYIVGALYIIATVYVTKTRAGIRMIAVGGNPEAVRRVGLNDNYYKMAGFVLSALLAAIGGLVTTAVVTEASPQANPAIIFDALTAVALAGVSLAGGRGSLPKVLVGAIILATISDGLTVVGVPPYWARVSTGVLLIAALVLDRVLTAIISERLIMIGDLTVHSGRAPA